MKRSRPATRWSLIVIVIVASSLTYAGFRYLYPRQPANIFAITPASIEYGDTTITGILRKDVPVGQAGNYLLILSDNRAVLLDAQGLDSLLGNSVTVTGYLMPAEGDLFPMTMNVSSLTVN